MSILWAKSGPASMAIGPRGDRTYRRTFTLRSDTPNESKRAIIFSGFLPVFGLSPYPEDPQAICNHVEPVQNPNGPYHWTVACEWSTLQEGNPADKQKEPDQRRPIWSYTFQPLQKYWPCDLDGLAYQDSAHTPFDPPPLTAEAQRADGPRLRADHRQCWPWPARRSIPSGSAG